MPVTRSQSSPYNLATGVPVGPGRFAIPQADASGATLTYDLGDRTADRTWNGDGLHLSAEARVRAGSSDAESLEYVRLRMGAEGLDAKVDLVRDGETKLRFRGLSLKDGAFKGSVNDARDYLKENPLAATGVAVGTVVLARQIAERTGDDVTFDTGKIKLYEEGGLTASAVGELAIPAKGAWIQPTGAKLKLEYADPDKTYGTMSLEAGYDRDARSRVSAGWNKTFDNGLQAGASAYYEEKNHNYGVQLGISYKF